MRPVALAASKRYLQAFAEAAEKQDEHVSALSAPSGKFRVGQFPMTEDLILVNEHNRAAGREEKSAVHSAGLLHRAFSIFLADENGQLLLQRRSRVKYHSAGLWANSCCGHPRPGESTLRAARRRMGEELGAVTSLRYGFQARYRTVLPNGLIENELVYVYFGLTPSHLAPNPDEVSGVARMSLASLRADITRRPRRYTYWLRYYFKNHYEAIRRGLDEMRQDATSVTDGVKTRAATAPRSDA
jgi:isopentenyl-diphosphate delta-isomerase